MSRRRLPHVALGIAVALAGAAGPTADDAAPRAVDERGTPVDFKLAMFGDSGVDGISDAVFRLVRDEGAEAVLHLGDFDYRHDPRRWEAQIDRHLGPDFPFFAVVGNHDRRKWIAYQERLQRRVERVGADCAGDLGVDSACRYRGLLLVLSGAGTKGTDPAAFIRRELAASDARWRICAWHKNQRALQPANKRDDVGWAPYEACREGGAFVVSGHAHAYSRTHLLADFETRDIASTDDELELSGGRSFAVVSGLGGRHAHRGRVDGPWFATIHIADREDEHGALFCVFNPGGAAERADCYFKDVAGRVHDRFTVLRPAGAPGLPPARAPEHNGAGR